MFSDISIEVDSLSKCYQVYEQPHDRLKQFVMPYVQKLFGLKSKKYFREFWALKEISFKVKKGETVGIIGRNGSGKSTLLQLICGTLNPTAGSIKATGRIAALLELGSGFNPEFTGRENIYMNASVLGLSSREIDARFQDIVDFSEIGDFLDQPVKTYSSGMYVRLAFSVIAHVEADILIIDEALAVGDIFFTQKCIRFLEDFKKKGTVLLVTHDTNSVLSLCDRAIWLNKGDLICLDQAKIVCEAYLEELYSTKTKSLEVDAKNNFEKYLPVQDFLDVRSELINSSLLRNDLQVFKFSNTGSKFGTDLVQIIDVYFGDVTKGPVSWFVGGEIVELKIVLRTDIILDEPIIGFLIKDKLGQNLFGENTYLRTIDSPFIVQPNSQFEVKFLFRMPIMPSGDYSVGVAVANGTQENHVIHQWIHDAIVFKSHSDSVSTGLLGIPMLDIELNINES